MKALALFALSIPMWAQTSAGLVACQLNLESPETMKDLYGGKVPILAGHIYCKNYSSLTVGPISSADFYLALGTVNTMTAADASALLTRVYGRSVASQAGTAVQSANTGMSLLAGLKQLSISASSLGWIGFGVGIGTQAILPFFTAGQPNLSSLLANQCDALNASTLAPGQSIGPCTMYVQKPIKGVHLQGAIPFDLVPTGPGPSGPLPPNAPVMLSPRRAMLDSPVDTRSLNAEIAAKVARETPVEPLQSGISNWDSGSDNTWKIVAGDAKPTVKKSLTVQNASIAKDMPPICAAEGVTCTSYPDKPTVVQLATPVAVSHPQAYQVTQLEDLQRQVAQLSAAVQHLVDAQNYRGSVLTPQ